MTRDELDQNKKYLLGDIRAVLEVHAKHQSISTKTIDNVIEGYGVNLVEDFYFDALCEIQEAEEQQARKDERDLRRNSPVVL